MKRFIKGGTARIFKLKSANGQSKVSRLVVDSMRGMAAMQRGDWPTANNIWREIITLVGNDAPIEVYINLSQSLRHSANFIEADQVLTGPLRKSPDSKPLMSEFAEVASARKNWPEAVMRWQAVLNKFGDGSPENCFVRLAYALAKTGEIKSADQIVGRGIKARPDSMAIKVACAKVAMENSDWTEAAKRWQKILGEYELGLPPKVLALAIKSLRLAGKFKMAEEFIDQALVEYGQQLPLLIERAELAGDNKKWSDAIKHWQSILDKFANLSDANRLLARFNLSVLKRLNDLPAYKKQIANYQKSKSKPKKAVIYTAVSKGYDSLKLPEIIDPNFDYICYTDDPSIDGFGVFDIRPFPVIEKDPARTIRYPKTHAHVLFKDYPLAVWIDTSLMISGDIKPLLNKFDKSGLPLGSTPHPYRQSIDEEYWACVNLLKDDPDVMKHQIDSYKKESVHITSFAENGLLLFKPSAPKLEDVMETWWQQVLKFSKRDQLSFGYSVAKAGVDWFHISEKPVNMRNHPDFILSPHFSDNSLLDELYKQLS